MISFAEYQITAFVTLKKVIAVATVKNVVARPAGSGVIAAIGKDHIIPCTTLNGVSTIVRTVENVISVPTIEYDIDAFQKARSDVTVTVRNLSRGHKFSSLGVAD